MPGDPTLTAKGNEIPDTLMGYIPWSPELDSGEVCGIPTTFKTREAWKGKKVVVVSIPGAYTPICHQQHIPPLVKRVDELKAKGVDSVYVIASNDPFVMGAWGNFNHAQDKVIFATDIDLAFSKGLGATIDLSAKHFGERTARYALIIDDNKIVDFASDEGDTGKLQNASIDTILTKV
ncbi:peroxiredoxin type-2 [Malassezia obtusa]|uniref:Peroxiredoxin type-2 n=1 Tax=Malassezia obtusa TaxID=76774 RepID=A0AAF0E389_9BASI|nr:peroxiredoxin type-2 [Malassezia obtusa]